MARMSDGTAEIPEYIRRQMRTNRGLLPSLGYLKKVLSIVRRRGFSYRFGSDFDIQFFAGAAPASGVFDLRDDGFVRWAWGREKDQREAVRKQNPLRVVVDWFSAN